MKYLDKLRDIMFNEVELTQLIKEANDLIRRKRIRQTPRQYLKVYGNGKIRFYSYHFKSARRLDKKNKRGLYE